MRSANKYIHIYKTAPDKILHKKGKTEIQRGTKNMKRPSPDPAKVTEGPASCNIV